MRPRKRANTGCRPCWAPATRPRPCTRATTSWWMPTKVRSTGWAVNSMNSLLLDEDDGSPVGFGLGPAEGAAPAPACATCFRDSLTRSRNSLPTLKNGRRLGCTWTGWPVRGLRPSYDLYSRTVKLPKPRISMPSPFFKSSTIESKMQLTMSSAFPLGSFVRSETASMSSDFVMRSLPVSMVRDCMLLEPPVPINPYFQLLAGAPRKRPQGRWGVRSLLPPLVAAKEGVLVAVVPGVKVDDVRPAYLPRIRSRLNIPPRHQLARLSDG